MRGFSLFAERLDLPEAFMRILHLPSTVLSITLLLQSCSGRYQTPISFPGSFNAAAPTVQKSPIVTASRKPARPAVTPTATGERLEFCALVGVENRRLFAFETAHYFVNVCQKSTQGRTFYRGQEKGKSNVPVQVTASPTKRGYRAINGSTTYVVSIMMQSSRTSLPYPL